VSRAAGLRGKGGVGGGRSEDVEILFPNAGGGEYREPVVVDRLRGLNEGERDVELVVLADLGLLVGDPGVRISGCNAPRRFKEFEFDVKGLSGSSSVKPLVESRPRT